MKHLLVTLVAMLSLPSMAYANEYEMDPVHSQIGFSVKHMAVATVHGEFKKFGGTIDIDDKNPANSKLDINIDAASIDTGNDKRDGHLKSPDFFDVAKYPTITFKSKTVKVVSPTAWDVSGDLTMHGKTKEIMLHVTDLTPDVPSPMDKKNHRGASATAQVNRMDFDVKWNAPMSKAGDVVVSNDVKINIDVELVQKGK